jgi:hypothetical protein
MPNAHRFRLILALALFATAGCAINTLRVEYATSVAAKGKAAMIAARAFLGQVQAGRQNTDIEVLSADPACNWPGFISLVRPQPNVGRGMPAYGWLCWPPGHTKLLTDIELSRGSLDDKMRPTLALIESITTYIDALAEIVATTDSDPTQGLTDALTTARSVEGFFDAVTGNETHQVPAAADPRVTAVTAFIRMLAVFQRESEQVDQLRALIARERPDGGAQGAIDELRRRLGIWDTIRAADDGVRRTVNNRLLNAVLTRQPPLTVAARREALRANYDRRAASEAGDLLFPAVARLLDELKKADDDLRRVLRENPHLSAREGRRVAEMNRRRVISALDSVTALITAFRGA